MLDDPTVGTEFISRLDAAYGYLDLEVNESGEIYRFGLVAPEVSLEVDQKQAEQIRSELIHLCQRGSGLCGHNIRRFDYPHLIQQWPELDSLLIVDTLELSVLVFPLQPSHKLQKHYKLSNYASNNPLEDAKATRLLLQHILQALNQQPLALQQAYVGLLTGGQTTADHAYQTFFKVLELAVSDLPGLETLPAGAIADLDLTCLRQAWQQPDDLTFDNRLIVAALLSWNYARNQAQSQQYPSAWLTHLPSFHAVLNSLFPLTQTGFTYQPYLQEFELSEFRSPQEEAVQAIIDRRNPLVLMPTGGGKSLCYQLPALMFYRRQWGLTVCVSPLQALMEDQVADLQKIGLDFATFINNTLAPEDRAHRLEELRQGCKGLLYISPEQLRSINIRALLQERPPVLWVIDEAHCVSQWGHDFRPDYRYIPKFIQELYAERQLPRPCLALLTATATAKVRKDIQALFSKFELPIGLEISSPSQRPNLEYRIVPVQGDKDALIREAVNAGLAQEGCALVYTTTRNNAEWLARMLQQFNIEAQYYHGKLSKQEKGEVLQAFKQKTLNVVTATCAFGMGINRSDVRAVIHHTLSSSLESYVQEAGRAGRDGEPATCTLLFDEQDADTIFFLRSLNRLTLTDLHNIFLAILNLRKRVYGPTSSEKDWFWITSSEIVQAGSLDEAFASEEEQRDTKIQVALYHLEKFGLIERAENLSSYVQFDLVQASPQASCQQFEQYSRNQNLSASQVMQFERLIYAMHLAKADWQQQNALFPLDRLSYESGIPVEELSNRIRELQQAGVCSSQIPIALLVTKGVVGDAQKLHDRIRAVEEALLEELLPLMGDRDQIQINLKGMATRLDPDGTQGIRAATLLDILEGWRSQQWVKLKRLGASSVQLTGLEVEVPNYLTRHQTLSQVLLQVLYAGLGSQRGARLRLEYDLGKLLEEINRRTRPLAWEEFELKILLLWLHQRKIIRLADGLSLFHQAFKVRVLRYISSRDVEFKAISDEYPTLQKHYDEQNQRTHLMVQYGKLTDEGDRQQLLADYFQLSPEEFAKAYPDLDTAEVKLPVTQADYNRIMGSLNPIQQAIVTTESAAIAVIAGPGSGKTRTIVHRIAYLVKVKRVPPDRILVLAYNRNAVKELRIRLQKLIGSLVTHVRIFTFHGLALSLLGRTLGEAKPRRRDSEIAFKQLLQDACALIQQGEEPTEAAPDDEDVPFRRIQLLGNLEHVFVDEYQDVAEDEYRLIQLTVGLNQVEELDRSVQINLCVIGDDDQNIYEFRQTSPRYIRQFVAEYRAEERLLTENYRSTEPIIAAANRLIAHSQERCKRTPDQQVHINQERDQQGGVPVKAWQFNQAAAQASWICEQIQFWLQQGSAVSDIAVLARQWETLSPVRCLLEKAGIATYALKGSGIALVRNRLACQLINLLKAAPQLLLSAQESVQDLFRTFFAQWGRQVQEPTVQMLLRIASDLDQERGWGFSEVAVSISADEILTALFEFNESGETYLQENSVLVTSCHGAKGLEFQKVILIADGFSNRSYEIESERRLFYVAMTRTKEELVLCSTQASHFIQETGVSAQPLEIPDFNLPEKMLYWDLTPGHVHLGHKATRQQQALIEGLWEGEPLRLVTNRFGNGWEVQTQKQQTIGALSRFGVAELQKKQIALGQFQFQPGEVTVRHIYRHLKMDEVTEEPLEDWFVVIPQIRVCR